MFDVRCAAKFQLARQFMGESIVMSFLAFITAIILCPLVLPLFNQFAGKQVSTPFFCHPWYIVNLFFISVGIGIVAGFYPALVLSSFKPVSVLKGRFATGTKGILLRKVLVVFQFTISIILIIGTVIVYTQLNYMRSQDLGFNKDQTIIIDTSQDRKFKPSFGLLVIALLQAFRTNTNNGSVWLYLRHFFLGTSVAAEVNNIFTY